MRKFLDWLAVHGVGLAFAFCLTVVMALAGVGLLLVVLAVHWWDKVR